MSSPQQEVNPFLFPGKRAAFLFRKGPEQAGHASHAEAREEIHGYPDDIASVRREHYIPGTLQLYRATLSAEDRLRLLRGCSK